MPAPDRLDDLHRQRALVQEHLAWLDREIAADKAARRPAPWPPSPPHASAAPASPSPIAAHADETALVAEAIAKDYLVPSAAVKTDVKKGCFLYFALAFVLLAAGVAGLYFALRH